MAVDSDLMVSWAVTPCSMADRYQNISALQVEAAGFYKVLVSNTILRDINPEHITLCIYRNEFSISISAAP
jgi:hypothetical protein